MSDSSKTPDAQAKRQAGIEKFTEVMKFEPPDMPGDLFLDTTIEHLFANVWSRPGLSTRDRRLITLTVLMSLGNEMALTLHLDAARKSGDLKDEELDELVLHIAHYLGWPPAAVASSILGRVRAKDNS